MEGGGSERRRPGRSMQEACFFRGNGKNQAVMCKSDRLLVELHCKKELHCMERLSMKKRIDPNGLSALPDDGQEGENSSANRLHLCHWL